MSEPQLPERRIARYGFRPSLHRFDEPIADPASLKVAPEVDPRDVLSTLLLNHASLGSCTSNATEVAFRYDAILDGHDPGPLCRLQIYWGERKIEHMLGQGDTGAEGHDAFTVAKHGLVAETVWPYDWPGITNDEPCPVSYFDPPKLPQAVIATPPAYTLKKKVVLVPHDEQAIKAILSNRQTIAIGFTVYESFEAASVAKTGIMPVPIAGEKVLGGHEVLVVGYLKSEPEYALVQNSWGSWGQAGFFFMPWAVLLNSRMTSDLRTIVRTTTQ